MMGSLHMAVDIGAASGRVFVGALRDGKLWSEEIHRFVTRDIFLIGERVRNIYRYYEEILGALRVYSHKFGKELSSIGVDSFGSDFTLLDREGRLAMITPSYRQNNQEPMDGDIEEKFGGFALYRRTGNHTMPSDTLQQLLRMQKTRHTALEDPGAILFFADIFHYLLGAPACCEHSLASYCRFYNNRENIWDDEVMQAFNLPARLKTNVVYCGERIGVMHAEVAADAGLSAGTAIIAPCSHDTACAALTVPDEDDDWLFISSGSWSLLGTKTPKPVLSEKAWRHNMSNSSMPFHANMFKRIINGMWLMQQCQIAWMRCSFPEMAALAETAGDIDCYIDVNDRKFLAPSNMPMAIAMDIQNRYGITMDPDNVGAITRVCLQSLAMKYRFYGELIGQLTGRTFKKIYIIGGGSKNTLLNRITAGVTGLPVYTGIYEASAIGNLFLQIYGSGLLSSLEDIHKIIRDTFPMTIDKPCDSKHWDGKYWKYLRDFADLV